VNNLTLIFILNLSRVLGRGRTFQKDGRFGIFLYFFFLVDQRKKSTAEILKEKLISGIWSWQPFGEQNSVELCSRISGHPTLGN